MTIKNIDIQQINSLESLKKYGPYHSIKKTIELKIGFRLGVKGWKDLYKKISAIKRYFECGHSDIDIIISANELSLAKTKLYEIFDIKIPAKSRSELSDMVTQLLSFFKKTSLTAHERYELNKRKNFINSSKLEGIDIPSIPNKMSLDDVLKKYKATNYG